jgi:Flp pilus assembly protein TadG
MKHSILKNRRGATLAIVGISLFALVGVAALVTDIGQLYVGKQRAQNVSDAAALGGAWLLAGAGTPTTAARSAAQSVVSKNNEITPAWQVANVSITFPTTFQKDNGATVSVAQGEAIRVSCETPVTFGFARVLGFERGSPEATAIVMRTPASELTYDFCPWMVCNTSVQSAGVGQQTTLKVINPSDSDNFVGSGNFLCVSFGNDSGASDYRARIEGTAPAAEVAIGDWINSEPGNMVGPTEQGLKTRLQGDVYASPQYDRYAFDLWRATGQTTGHYPDTNRIIVVPIVQDPGIELNGRSDLCVLGFAAFFIESIGKSNELTGRFISGTIDGENAQWGLDGFWGTNNLIATIKLVT